MWCNFQISASHKTEVSKLKNWMCVSGGFLQSQSHMDNKLVSDSDDRRKPPRDPADRKKNQAEKRAMLSGEPQPQLGPEPEI